MVNIDNFNETKSLVTSILKSYNLNDQKIDEMVTDNFIDGFLELEQLEPENNQFLNLARNFPVETNLNDIEVLDKSFRNEITSGGYFCDVLQYVIDSWMNIDLSQSPLSRSMAEDIGKGKIAGGVANNDENAIFLGKGSDIFTGGSGEDNVDGGSGFTNDQTVISAADITDEEGDTNTVHLGAGDDYYTGGKGTDKVLGEADSYIIHGGEGNDFLYGGDGNDFLHGEDGNDIIDGGEEDGKISTKFDILIAA